jgi:hypothetical protein
MLDLFLARPGLRLRRVNSGVTNWSSLFGRMDIIFLMVDFSCTHITDAFFWPWKKVIPDLERMAMMMI